MYVSLAPSFQVSQSGSFSGDWPSLPVPKAARSFTVWVHPGDQVKHAKAKSLFFPATGAKTQYALEMLQANVQ